MFDYIRNKFAQHPIPEGQLGNELAWSSSLLYGNYEFPQYNPDDLMQEKGSTIYRRMMIDEQVKAVTRFRRDSVTGREWFFEPPKGLSDEEAERRVELSKLIISRFPGTFKTKVLDAIMSSMYYGFSLTEKTFQQIEFESKTWVGIKSLRLKPYSSFLFYVDEFGDLLRLVQQLDGKEQDLNIHKFIHHVQNPDIHEHYGCSELREAHRSWFHKDMAIKFYGIHMERYASGFTLIQPEGDKVIKQGSPEATQLQTAMNAIRNAVSVMLPGKLKLTREQPVKTDAFEKAIALHDKAIAKSLLVPNLLGLSEQGQVGGFAQSQTQLEAFLWMLDADATSLEETLNEQLFKQLGELNWGDDDYPRFRFKPLSKAQLHDIVNTWASLVTSGAVRSSEADDAHIREILNFPSVDKDADAASVSQTQALNGAQVTSLVDIITRVVSGTLPKTTAIEIIVSAFPINRTQAEIMIADVEVKDVDDAGDIAPIPDTGDSDTGDSSDTDSEVSESPEEEPLDETILAAAAIAIKYKRDQANRRVDFVAIDRNSELIYVSNASLLAETLTDGVENILSEIETKGLGQEGSDPKEIAALSFETSDKRKINKVLDGTLSDSWKLGKQTAEQEIRKASRENNVNMARVNMVHLQETAVAWLNSQSFIMTGNLTDRTLAVIKTTLMNSVLKDLSFVEIEKEIYSRLASEGLVSDIKAKEILGAELGVENPSHRINTLVRTSSFKAINESRNTYFNDPALGDFVEAFEYSAILDSRTTAICNEMGGAGPAEPHTHSVDSVLWDDYRPPNHFNCRSLLIPIISGDTWTESSQPVNQPQAGFD